MEQQLFTLEETGKILSYKKTKIRELIARGDLHTNGERGAGLRVTRQSILNYLARCEPCPDEKPHNDGPKAKATTGRTRKVVTTIASPTKDGSTKWPTLTPTGRLQNLINSGKL